ncbi:unnamed protein product [Closterium sp. NIES-54]
MEVIFYETQSLDDWKAKRALGSVHKVSTSAVSAPSPGLLADEIHDPLDTLASAPPPPHVPTSIPYSTTPPVYPRVVPVTKPSTSSVLAVISSPLPAAESISRPTPDTLSKSADNNEGRHDALPSAPRIGIVDGRPAASSENGIPGVIGKDNNDAGESSGYSSSSDVVEVKLPSRHSTRSNFGVPPKKWANVCPVFANTILDDVNADTMLPELDLNMHADPERRWDISTMTVKEALASWKGKAMKAAMEEEIPSLLTNGTWELVPRPRGVNVMKNRYVTQRIFLSIVAVLDLHDMQLDMKNAYLRSKLDRVLHMEQPAYFNDALDSVLIGGGWSKSQVDEALYFKFGADGVGCWLLVYVDDLLAASSSPEMLKDLRELLQNAFELAYVDKLRRCFVDEEQTGRCPKTPISVDAYTELTFDDKEYQAREEEYRQKVGSLQFAATTTRPDIAYACSKLGSGLTIRSDQHWRELDHCIDYMVNTCDFTLEFGGGPDTLRLVGYADSDDAGDRQTRSTTS